MPSCPSYEQLVKRWKLYEVNVPKKGRGVFAGTSIPPQQLVLKFDGPLFERETCPNFEESIQVGNGGSKTVMSGVPPVALQWDVRHGS
jgi:hypothetical protein